MLDSDSHTVSGKITKKTPKENALLTCPSCENGGVFTTIGGPPMSHPHYFPVIEQAWRLSMSALVARVVLGGGGYRAPS